MKIYSVNEYKRNGRDTYRLFRKEDKALEYAKELHRRASIGMVEYLEEHVAGRLFRWYWIPEDEYDEEILEHEVVVHEENVY